ncbi:alpha/beta-hydrolase [Epithele typhae]|uniref:alpha/beta-hydrolase n=1 Tax=Epithele typhae TaxID=378194 RepID=UPI002007E440|nr:alpha/beta-hydrolase [Epithele typhae]KAH9912758.1 alpha/beta-hydrolase [Epithele typhae]
MRLFSVLALLYAAVAASPTSHIDGLREGASRVEMTSLNIADAKIRAVKNSGVCETTPGVGQMSGYLDVGRTCPCAWQWFWFFEARDDPENAPFTLWLNGGPGCSSMIGLFQEHGPCQVDEDGQTTVLNPFSWNNISNMIYIDQPIGTGFSFGTVNVNSTFAAAPAIWTAFQVLFESQDFAKFQSREFILATESYGGHYGPEFVEFFDEQNAKIKDGSIQGEEINVSALMINNGWYDPLLQNKAYLDFATFAPGYGQLQNDTVLAAMNESFFGAGGCMEQELACYAAGGDQGLPGETTASNKICINADDFCIENLLIPSTIGRDIDDLRQSDDSPNLFPPEFYVSFLRNQTVMNAIGAQARYSECSNPVGNQFGRTGDDARSLLPALANLANERMKILIWAGDADINCNWLGGHASVLAMDWYGNETLHATPFTNMTIGDTAIAAIQNVDNFSFARVFQAGHEVPAFQPAAALEIFSQIIRKEQLHSVP